MELTMPGVQALEAAIHAGERIVATMHHALGGLLPQRPGDGLSGQASAPAACRHR